MKEYDKKEFLIMVELFFHTATNSQGNPIPYSKQGIIDTLDRYGWEYIKEHWEIASEVMGNADEKDIERLSRETESINILYEFHHKVVLAEVTDVAIQLEKEGKLESGVDENGDIVFRPTGK